MNAFQLIGKIIEILLGFITFVFLLVWTTDELIHFSTSRISKLKRQLKKKKPLK